MKGWVNATSVFYKRQESQTVKVRQLIRDGMEGASPNSECQNSGTRELVNFREGIDFDGQSSPNHDLFIVGVQGDVTSSNFPIGFAEQIQLIAVAEQMEKLTKNDGCASRAIWSRTSMGPR